MPEVFNSIINSRGNQWRDWIIENIQRGCADESIISKMIDKELWTITEARQAIKEAHDIFDNRKTLNFSRPKIPNCDNFTFSDGHRLSILGRCARPEVAILDGLLTNAECNCLIEQAYAKGLMRSGVVDPITGQTTQHQARTSTSVFFRRNETKEVALIENRLSELTGWPIENGEGLQILRYENGQEYRQHYDWFNSETKGGMHHLKRGGQRYATTVVTLMRAEKGGSTSFSMTGLEVTPRVGGAVFFENITPAGVTDANALHGGSIVESGVKIVATYWQRQAAFV